MAILCKFLHGKLGIDKHNAEGSGKHEVALFCDCKMLHQDLTVGMLQELMFSEFPEVSQHQHDLPLHLS